MKIKTILITACLVVGAGAATSYFVRRSSENNVRKVEVVPVTSVNSAEYSYGDSGTVSGTIISRDTQVVSLDTSHELVEVCVQQGDRVKKGDKLLEYDMLGDELKAEMEELTKLGLELTLESMKKDLAIMMSGRMPESLTDGDADSDPDAPSYDNDNDDDDDDDAGTPQNSGTAAPKKQKQGKGAVGAADTLAGRPVWTGVNGIRTSFDGSILTPDQISAYIQKNPDLLQALLQKKKESALSADQAVSDGEDDIVVDAADPADAANPVDEADPADDADAVDLVYLSSLFDEDGNFIGGEEDLDQLLIFLEESSDPLISSPDDDSNPLVKDAITADDSQDKEGLFGNPEEEENEPGIQDGLFDEDSNEIVADTPALTGENPPALTGGNAPALVGENAPALIEEDSSALPGEETVPDEDASAGNGESTSAGNGEEASAGKTEEALALVSADDEVIADPDNPTPETLSEGSAVVEETSPSDTGEVFLPEGEDSSLPGTDQEGSDNSSESEANALDEDGYPIFGDEVYEPGEIAIPVDENAAELETNFDGEMYVDDDSEQVTDIISDVNNFLSAVNEISLAVDGNWDAVPSQMGAIDAAIQQFRGMFAIADEKDKNDLFGDTVRVLVYTVSPEVRSRVGDATVTVLQAAYDKLCIYHFINTMLTLNAERSDSAALGQDWAKTNEQALRAAVLEYASLPDSVWIYNPATQATEFSSQFASLNDAFFSGESLRDFLKTQVLSLNTNYVMEEKTDVPPTVSTEGKMYDLNGSDDDDDYDGPEYTAEELAEAIKEQQKNIKETELQIREAELGIKEYQKILDGKIVYATMDGIVKNAGTKTSSYGNSFITITGKEGLYVKGTVNELSLDTVKVGDTITGTSYETGSTFTAEIVEISDYPDTSTNSYYYGFGDENTNSSYYPFLAYIEDAEGLEVDSYVDLSLTNSSGDGSADSLFNGGLALEEYFIRKDGNGRSYCYVRGKDGLLEKRYLELGANNWGVITIKSGLTQNDYIAFPYGDGVEDGAQTVEVDYLTAVEGDVY